MKIAISIPAYNEENTIGRVINEIKNTMDKTDLKYFIIVVDDGSRDQTAKIAKEKGAIVYSNSRNLGLAKTFEKEMEYCIKKGADIIVHIDADGQYPAKYIPLMINKIEEGYDLVLGSRFAGKIEYMPLSKRLGNIAFSKVLPIITKIKLKDTTTGFRAFTKEVASEINFINDFTYTQEQIIRAAKQKFRITEIPVYARKTRESRLFKSPLEYAIKAWINIFRIYRDYEPIKFFGYFGLFFLVMGFIPGVWAFYNLITTNSVGGLPKVMLSVLLISMGVQILLFGFLADMNRK